MQWYNNPLHIFYFIYFIDLIAVAVMSVNEYMLLFYFILFLLIFYFIFNNF